MNFPETTYLKPYRTVTPEEEDVFIELFSDKVTPGDYGPVGEWDMNGTFTRWTRGFVIAFFVIPLLVPCWFRNSGMIRCCLMISIFCMYIFWSILFIAQSNPLIGPRMHSDAAAWMGIKWGLMPSSGGLRRIMKPVIEPETETETEPITTIEYTPIVS